MAQLTTPPPGWSPEKWATLGRAERRQAIRDAARARKKKT